MERFDDAYEGTPPWDIGRPQSTIVALQEAGKIVGTVLDVGCGTGENALYLAERGHEVWGIDGAPRAIEKARAKAAERDLDVDFKVSDALDLSGLGRTFDTVIDVGFFHSLDDESRERWVKSLASVLEAGGRYYVLTFSDKVDFEGGPRRVRREEFGQTFGGEFKVISVEEAVLDSSRGSGGGVQAWLATIERNLTSC